VNKSRAAQEVDVGDGQANTSPGAGGVTCYVLRGRALNVFRRRDFESHNLVARRQLDLATQLSLPGVLEDIPVGIEVGQGESHIQLELVSVGIVPGKNLPDLVCRARGKINLRQRHAAAWWPAMLPYVQP
jgi:hypothetical protein